ncbi:TIGR03086 family metal-binding protein [Streptomyces jumonjinensis]|uniref:TIGR03086 family protein n=1 Tax=Streptomyces jumonjinensis TaxID=1945 RepID=A0A646KKB9_STRJU|nr:TIGR03086 family metal-binding protein [Streptomyces jumonjinensis]MQT02673.1 TIGR03086 family protein [Streptomyces jumonjinensis]
MDPTSQTPAPDATAPGGAESQGASGHPDLRAAADGVALLLGGVGDERLGDPTPCSDYSVRELLAHLVGLVAAFRDTARKDLGPTTDTDPRAVPLVLPDDWRELLPRRLEELVAAWARPGAWDGETRAGGVDLPSAIAGRIAMNELTVHGWDLARATGQPYAPDEASLRVSYELMRPTGDDGADAAREGIFGPVVPVPDGASLLDRVVGVNGRRPDWRPGG